eukprot:366009-Chlamydomonas_euryale.AAC.38
MCPQEHACMPAHVPLSARFPPTQSSPAPGPTCPHPSTRLSNATTRGSGTLPHRVADHKHGHGAKADAEHGPKRFRLGLNLLPDVGLFPPWPVAQPPHLREGRHGRQHLELPSRVENDLQHKDADQHSCRKRRAEQHGEHGCAAALAQAVCCEDRRPRTKQEVAAAGWKERGWSTCRCRCD